MYAYLKNEDVKNQQAAMKKAQSFELEIQIAIEKVHEAVKLHVKICAPTVSASHENQLTYSSAPNVSIQAYLHFLYKAVKVLKVEKPAKKIVFANHSLKPLKVPTFGGDKTKFEDFWMLFGSLVDQSKESVNLKMARLRQCLFGSALESIGGLRTAEPEYEEAKEILQLKFRGQRRQLRACISWKKCHKWRVTMSKDLKNLPTYLGLPW